MRVSLGVLRPFESGGSTVLLLLLFLYYAVESVPTVAELLYYNSAHSNEIGHTYTVDDIHTGIALELCPRLCLPHAYTRSNLYSTVVQLIRLRASDCDTVVVPGLRSTPAFGVEVHGCAAVTIAHDTVLQYCSAVSWARSNLTSACLCDKRDRRCLVAFLTEECLDRALSSGTIIVYRISSCVQCRRIICLDCLSCISTRAGYTERRKQAASTAAIRPLRRLVAPTPCVFPTDALFCGTTVLQSPCVLRSSPH